MSFELFGLNVDTYNFEEALLKAKELIDGNHVAQIVTINPEMFEYANKENDFANIIKEAEMVIPDGVGVKIALKINGKNVNRIPGIDFAKRLLEETSINSIPVAIIGAKEEVITKAIDVNVAMAAALTLKRNIKEVLSALTLLFLFLAIFLIIT